MARRHAPVLEPPPADIPIELAAVPRVNRDKQTLWTRRRQIRERGLSARSKELSRINEGLVAAAMVMDPNSYNAPSPNAITRTWQHAAFGYRASVGELNAATMYVGNALSQCSLTVGKRNPDGSVEQGYDGEEPVDGLETAVAEEASDLISVIRSKRGGQSELLRSSGEKLFVAGELYYVPEDTPQGIQFDILSTQELLRDGNTWTKYLGPGYGAVPLPPGVNPVRVWRSDGQWSMLATSSVRSCLELLEELVVLTRLVRSSAISRMALAGVLAIPDELDTPDDEEGPDGQQSEAMNPLAVDMINTGAKAIDDPANASAWMPFIIQGPAEYLQHIKHIPFEAASQEQVIQRTEALQRLAQGLDMPVEVILGHMSTTFTNAQQISIDTFRIHLEPTLQLICDALTVAYLWPAMAKNRGIDPEHLAAGEPYPDDILSVAVTYDAHHLVSQPDRSKDMLELYVHDTTQSSVKIAEIRDTLGLDPNEVVDPLEIAARVDAIRLTKIRETIVAPASDAAVGVSQIDDAVVPGESGGSQIIEKKVGTAGITASASIAGHSEPEAVLAWKVQAACDLTVARAVERLGAKLRTKFKQPEREKWAAISNADLASHLGIDETTRFLGGDTDEAVRAEVSTLVTHVSEWASAAGHTHPSDVAAAVGVLAVDTVQLHITIGAPMTVDHGVVCGMLDGAT